ncbi:hypothetical protein V8B97DRAFT_1921059, partial [Scleroderma yunnanense]
MTEAFGRGVETIQIEQDMQNFVALLWGTSSSPTSGPTFTAGTGLAIAMQAHPKSEDIIMGAQQPVKPMHAPSTWCKGTVWWMPIVHDATNAMIAEEDKDNEEHAQHTDMGVGTSGGGAPCIA